MIALERATLETPGIEGVVLRYGFFYGAGTYARGGPMDEDIRKRRMPVVGSGEGRFSFVHVDDAAAATVLALDHGAPGIYNVADDQPAQQREWVRELARILDAPKPRRVPLWLGRLFAGPMALGAVSLRGASNAKAKRELGWTRRTRTGGAASRRSSAASARKRSTLRPASPLCVGGRGLMAAAAADVAARRPRRRRRSASADAAPRRRRSARRRRLGAAASPFSRSVDASAAASASAGDRPQRSRPAQPPQRQRPPRLSSGLGLRSGGLELLLVDLAAQHGLRRAEHHRHVAAVEVRALLDRRPAPASSSARRSRIILPRSGWVTSRPRNMIVILTLSLCSRKRVTCPFFVA